MAHPDKVGPCLEAALPGFQLQLTAVGTHILVAEGAEPLGADSLVPTGLQVAIDFGYDSLMSSRELASLATQTGLCHNLAKQHGEHVSLALCGLDSSSSASAFLEAAGVDSWHLTQHERLSAMEAPLIYLSPDAEEVLDDLDPAAVYVIGALIDRSVQSGASLARAAAGGCCARRLPLREHLSPDMLHDIKSALNINAVFHVLIEWTHCRSWQAALLSGLRQSQRTTAISPAPFSTPIQPPIGGRGDTPNGATVDVITPDITMPDVITPKAQGTHMGHAHMTTLEGQVTWRRRFNSVFHFLDMRTAAESDGSVTRVLVSSGHMPEGEAKAAGRVRCGDTVRATGMLDSELLRVTAIEVLSCWSEQHPDAPFQPQPRSRATNAFPAVPPKVTGNTLVDEVSLTQTVCKFFVNTGRCTTPDCRYAHDATARGEWVAERQRLRRALAQQDGERLGDPHPADSKASASRRASIFVDFLIATYGATALGAGTGVLDVAGGRGDVSFELYCGRSIRSILVDPRPQRPRKHHWKLLLARNGAEAQLPRQLLARVGDTFGAEPAERALLVSTSVFVGMHPDQATEWIVDTALRENKPFAIVPCCVFSDAFRRRFSDGRPVTTYNDFIEYLLAKDPAILRGWLPFVGKNCVLYRAADIKALGASSKENLACVPCDTSPPQVVKNTQ